MKTLRWMSVSLLALGAVACGDDSGGGSTAEWCDVAQSVENQFDDMGDAFGAEAAELEKLFGDMKKTIDDAVDAAPSEIKDAVEETADAIGAMQKELADVDYNILDIDQAAFSAIADDSQAAADKIEAFNEEECGIVASDSGDDTEETGDTLGGGGTGREQIASMLQDQLNLTEEEASCISENIDVSIAEQAGTDPTALLGVFETCGIGIERLAEIGAATGG